MNADILREKFLDFFKSKKHKIVESDSLVPQDDPTVLFTPAGMNQFKKEFLAAKSGLSRVATSQRCLRTDDLDKVGKTSGHHTFFEMLGNFSFGDYFKEEAITWAWEFLIEELKINKDKLWVSVYKDDLEAYKIWNEKIGLPQNKIKKLGDKENFWPAEARLKGPNGPCGECSEIFFDQGLDVGCKKPDCHPSCNCGRFVEVWNLVFTQYNRKEGGILEPLPKKNIDTGMGLERLAAVMQGEPNNFKTDLFWPIVEEIRKQVGKSLRKEYENELVYAIADHIRAIVFAIYDGVLPSNEARGYVVRKLIRKAILNLRTLGIKNTLLYKLVPVLSGIMKVPYPQLEKRRENISEIILAEEKNFITILNSSSELLNKGLSELVKKMEDKTFSEDDVKKASIIAFELYDSYGIPWGLTKDWADAHGIKIDRGIFDIELEKQKTRSKLQSTMKGEVFGSKGLGLEVKETKFLGYKDYVVRSKILKIIKDNASVKRISKGDEATILLDKTPFYAEAGGQVGDTGQLAKGKNIFEVLDTKKLDKAIIHIGRVKAGNFKPQDLVSASLDLERRLAIARNHTATHLLQAALRKVLGAHVQQQGSLVAQDRLRFDFTHFKDISREELDRIEEIVNNYIIRNYAVQKKEQTLSAAKKSGALAFFGERYQAKVRVVSINGISKELCAGTHLDYVGAIGIFKILKAGSVSSGVRRIEAVTGTAAYKNIKGEGQTISDIASALKVPKENVVGELQKRLSRIKELEKQLEGRKFDTLKTSIDSDINAKENLNGIYFITHIDNNVNSVRKAVDLIKEKVRENAVIVSTTGDNLSGQVFVAIGATLDLCDKGIDASKLIKEVAQEIGGSGAGRKDFAQAGGRRPQNYKDALQKLKDKIRKIATC